MLTSEWAAAFNLLSIALLGLLSAGVLLTLMWPLFVRHFRQLPAYTLSRVLWLYVGFPWVVGIGCVFLFVPSFYLENSSWLGQFAHWHHPYVFNPISWHGATLFMFVLAVVYGLSARVLSAHRSYERSECTDLSFPG